MSAASDNNSHPGFSSNVIWFFGLPSAGKTTLASALCERIQALGQFSARLDGDQLRNGLCCNLGFTEDDRTENIRRAAEVAKLMAGMDACVVTSFITPLASHRQMVRGIIGEDKCRCVYVRCPLEECQSRDVKGLYRKAAEGRMTGMTGMDAPFEAPEAGEPVIVVDSKGTSVESCVDAILQALLTK